jgi:hypothetical protein
MCNNNNGRVNEIHIKINVSQRKILIENFHRVVNGPKGWSWDPGVTRGVTQSLHG